jgi:hypothetical protein
MLVKIAEFCTTNVTVQQYVFTRIEEILGIGVDFSDSDRDIFGIKHAKLFTTDGKQLSDSTFSRAITFSDIYLQKSASLAFATLLTACDGNGAALVNWINTKLSSSSVGVFDVALPALCALTRSPTARTLLIANGTVNSIATVLKKIGVGANPQYIYDLIVSLWAISLTETDPRPYLTSGTVPILLEFLASSSSKKILRVIIYTLKNLASFNNEQIINEMYSSGVLRLIENLTNAHTVSQLNDGDADNDFKMLSDILHKNYRELSSFDRLNSEYDSGALRWGILHNEKFWRENAKFVEGNDFKLLKTMLTFVNSTDAVSTL